MLRELQSLLAFTQSTLRCFSCADVLDNRDERVGLASAVPHTGNRQVNPYVGTIFSDITLLHREHVERAVQQFCGLREVSGKIIRVRDVLECETKKFLLAVSDDPVLLARHRLR